MKLILEVSAGVAVGQFVHYYSIRWYATALSKLKGRFKK